MVCETARSLFPLPFPILHTREFKAGWFVRLLARDFPSPGPSPKLSLASRQRLSISDSGIAILAR